MHLHLGTVIWYHQLQLHTIKKLQINYIIKNERRNEYLACAESGMPFHGTENLSERVSFFPVEYVDDLYGGFKNSISISVSMFSIC